MRNHRAERAAVFLAAALSTPCGFAAPAPAPPLAACDAPEVAAVLAPAAAIDARAYWLDRSRIQWPGTEAGAHFKLYFSGRGAILASTGERVAGADGALGLAVDDHALPAALAERFKFIADGVRLTVRAADLPRLPALHRQQLVLVRENDAGEVLAATALQVAGALDDLYAGADRAELGAKVQAGATHFALWAPTARAVWLCSYASGGSPATAVETMRLDPHRGVWSHQRRSRLGGRYYAYIVDVFARGVGWVRNRVTDPYSLSLTTDSQRSYVADLNAADLKPAGWDSTPRPGRVQAATDMVIYELQVRDFSADDATVSAAHRGKYLAFTESASRGMQHLRRLADAGLTDVHLLPVFDIASVPEQGCVTPAVPAAAPDSAAQQAALEKTAATDCYNWGYDPWHFSAPEGSYATDAADGAVRIREFRAMVQALHRAGLRVGMDMVYNHTSASGQNPKSALDRIVPGYYHRLDAKGGVERSTCCENTATEHRMMAKLMIDSAVVWARDHKIDSMRFDLMGHQPREAMEHLQRAVNAAAGRPIHLLGEGWNYGEVENGKRFVQASQQSLNGSGIGTFSDRARDAVRGGWGGNADAVARSQGYINGLHYDRNAAAIQAGAGSVDDLKRSADLVRVGLAGTLRDYEMTTASGERRRLDAIAYNGQGAGYASQPGEVVNYVENHDNQTLFDNNAIKLPQGTSREDRARVQTLGAAIVAFSQGIAYFHAGQDILRSKSLDRNSFDSGDWFNRLDWSYADNHFGAGLPRQSDNGEHWNAMAPLLADAGIKPAAADIAWARDAFCDLLRIRASTTLLRLRTADDIKARLSFLNTGSAQVPGVLMARIDGAAYAGAVFKELVYLINVDKVAQTVVATELAGKAYVLHPVHGAPGAADPRAASASYAPQSGAFSVPARTAVVFVLN